MSEQQSGSARYSAAGASVGERVAGGSSAPTGRERRGRHAAPATKPGRSTGMRVASGLGELLVTLGMLLVLLVVYEIWVTDLVGARKQSAATRALDEQWAQAPDAEVVVTAPPGSSAAGSGDGKSTGGKATSQVLPGGTVTDPKTRVKTYDTTTGEGFAKLYIPSFGTDYVKTIIEGTNDDDLYIGPGHYPDSQYPGEQGNFAVAGHRVSKGSPFNDLDELRSCDAIIVQTRDDWFVYRVLPMQEEAATWNPAGRPHCEGVQRQTGKYAQTFGRQIVLPSAGDQAYPIPGVDTLTVPPDAQRLITLTTCHPQFSDAERMIIHGVLVRSYAKGPGFVPPELGEGN